MDAVIASELFFKEGISYYNCAEKLFDAFDDMELFLQSLSPIDYLYRHAAELMLKALIVKGLDQQCISDWESRKFSSQKLLLCNMHSLGALTKEWCLLYSNTLFPVENLPGYSYFLESIEAIDKVDFSSTFFRYPFSKQGVLNERTERFELDEELLSSVPCSIGNIISHEGPEHFRCYHLNNFDLGLCSVVKFLIKAFTGEEPSLLASQSQNGGLL